MKKVLEGRLYNTDTAKKLASWENMENATDFSWYEETLYRTKTGRYFVYGEGNAMSPYAKQISSVSWKWGEKIKPLTPEEAKAWAERLSSDRYNEIFGQAEEA